MDLRASLVNTLGYERALELPRIWRRPLSPMRPLPDFIIIGAQKSGTTSLYSSIVRHPGVRKALTRELHFFDNNFARGIAWYRSNFPMWWRTAVGEKRPWMTGEASPYYMLHPLAPLRAATVVPRARILAVLRHPVDRLYSHYQHERAKGTEHLDFEQALERESERTHDAWLQLTADAVPEAPAVQRYSYAARSRYDEQLTRWLECYPRAQLKVVQAEHLYRAPNQTMTGVYEFLGLEPQPSVAHEKLNARSYDGLDPRTRARLGVDFRDSVQRLRSLLDQDFDWDL